jgi:hypothetical protein
MAAIKWLTHAFMAKFVSSTLSTLLGNTQFNEYQTVYIGGLIPSLLA